MTTAYGVSLKSDEPCGRTLFRLIAASSAGFRSRAVFVPTGNFFDVLIQHELFALPISHESQSPAVMASPERRLGSSAGPICGCCKPA